MANIEIKSYNEQLGNLIRKITADTPVNDIHTGSVLLTLLEAVAANDFDNNVAILNTLELLNIDSVFNNNLDAMASNYGLVRKTAIKSSGNVTISDSAISKRSTTLYPIKAAPIVGTSVLYVNNASTWEQTGNLYIGRNTQNFEGPIGYTSIDNNGSFYTIHLASSLKKDHLISEEVIDAQNTSDRKVLAGTKVKIPANNLSPEISYVLVRDAILPSGEDSISGVPVIAQIAGSFANAGINTITQFDTLPFATAVVANTDAFTNGRDIETDTEFKDRIKSYSSTLARGTKSAILAAIVGISDPDDGKQVVSAVITEPVSTNDPSLVYLDDGSGFEPSYQGQSVDVLLDNASGNEEFLQLANFPIPRPQVVNTVDAPFLMEDGMTLRVIIDGIEDSVTFSKNDFKNISSATIIEVADAINNAATLFRCRFTETSSRLLLYPLSHDSEYIQIISGTDDANSVLKFPVNKYYSMALYQNDKALREKEGAATLTSLDFNSWNITSSGNLILSIDGTPAQDRSFDTVDFGNTPFNSLTLTQWVNAFNNKYAGITATLSTSNKLILQSNKSGSTSTIEVLGGSYATQMFDGQTYAVGQNSDFSLNRQNGAIQIKTAITKGDRFTAGLEDSKGSIISKSSSAGTYALSSDAAGRSAEFVVVTDADKVAIREVNMPINSTIEVVRLNDSRMRLLASTATSFYSIQPNDYIYIANRGDVSFVCGAYFLIKDITKLAGSIFTIKGVSFTEGVDFSATVNINITANALKNAILGSGNPLLSDISVDISGNRVYIKSSTLPNALTYTIGYSGDMAGAVTSSGTLIKMGFGNWISTGSCGLYKVIAKGQHIASGVDTYVDVLNYDSVSGGPYIVQDTLDIQAFYSNTYPQLWKSSSLSTPAVAPIKEVVESIGNNITGVVSSLYKTNYVKLTSTTESNGSIAIPVVSGNANLLFDVSGIKVGNQSHIANKIPQKDFISTFCRTKPSNENVWLDRHTYSDKKGLLSDYAIPSTSTDGETLTDDAGNLGENVSFSDVLNVTSGSNKGLINIIDSIIDANSIRVRKGKPYTLMDYLVDDAYQILKGLEISCEDNIVTVLDKDYAAKTIETKFSRLCRVNSGSQSHTFIPTSSSFSANDMENESGVDFGSVNIWGTASTQTNTNFNDYSVWFRARNWYVTGGTDSGNAALMLRAKSYGPIGEKIRFSIDYPASPNSPAKTYHENTPEFTTVKYIFKSSANKSTNIASGDKFTVTSFGSPLSKTYRLGFIGSTIDFSTLVSGDLISIASDSGVSSMNAGVYRILAVDSLNKTLDIYNPNGVETIIGTSTVFGVECTDASTLDGKYFILGTPSGLVKFWFNISGTTSEPEAGLTLFSQEITTVLSTMDSLAVATTVTATINSYSGLLADNFSGTSNVISVTCSDHGSVSGASAGTTSFTVVTTQGSYDTFEHITVATSVQFFSIDGTDITDIVNTINTNSKVINATILKTGVIAKSTKDETSSVAYNHSGIDYFVGLFDSVNWVSSFQNANPNFTLKNSLILSTAAALINPTNPIYKMDLVPNSDTSEVGELFKLVPTSLSNLKHQLTHKALSQLGIVSSVDFVDDNKKVQIKSKKLGSQGGIEIVGGRANEAYFNIIGDSQLVEANNNKYLAIKTPAFPETLNIGDHVELSNQTGAKRFDRIAATDTINVVKINDSSYEYRLNHKATNFSEFIKFTITDVSSQHGRAGTSSVWRWTFNDSGMYVILEDKTVGLINKLPNTYNESNVAGAALGIHSYIVNSGSSTSKLKFNMTCSGTPIQGDFFRFENSAGNSFAVWFDIDDNGTEPQNTIGSAYQTATNKIKVSILSTDTPNNIMSKLVSAIATVIVDDFELSTTQGANIDDVVVGDLLIVRSTTWDAGNTTSDTGDGQIAGLPIIAVNKDSRSFDVVNPFGVSMLSTSIGDTNINISSSFGIRWRLKHDVTSKYVIEKLGYNNHCRLRRTSGSSPMFTTCGVAVDDMLVISGESFNNFNVGKYRVLAVDEDSIIFKNDSAIEEFNDVNVFNNAGVQVNWTTNSNILTGVAGSFENLAVGVWIKKNTDDDDKFCQVVSRNGTSFSDATIITLGGQYQGVSAVAEGVIVDQINGINVGKKLLNVNDITVYEGDSVQVGDSVYVSNTSHVNWFKTNNVGLFTITEYGTNPIDYKNFIRVHNTSGLSQDSVKMNVLNSEFYLVEGENNKMSSIKKVEHLAIDEFDPDKRMVYLSPGDRAYKWSQSNTTKIRAMGKIGFDSDVVTGIDGYLYYTGLLRTVQRTIDGFEPDDLTYPGRKAVGSMIEILPPLKKNIKITLNVTTKNGVNLSEITNEIKSTIINYVNYLNVGVDVILSDIIVKVKGIDGVSSVTFITPEPTNERISIANNEKAYITSNDISIA